MKGSNQPMFSLGVIDSGTVLNCCPKAIRRTEGLGRQCPGAYDLHGVMKLLCNDVMKLLHDGLRKPLHDGVRKLVQK